VPPYRIDDDSMKFWRRPSPRGNVTQVTALRRALFLDFGGTLTRLENGRTLVDAEGHPVLNANVPETLARVRPGFDACFIVSNQARIGKGEITEAEVLGRFRWLNEHLGHPFTDWRCCPHREGDGCPCRKPLPGMFLDLARAHTIDLKRSVHVGDSDADRAAAAAAGIPVFVWAREFFRWP
jgi:histidinol-phosphate phosphatase family protein